MTLLADSLGPALPDPRREHRRNLALAELVIDPTANHALVAEVEGERVFIALAIRVPSAVKILIGEVTVPRASWCEHTFVLFARAMDGRAH
jgi:hypothetical protein